MKDRILAFLQNENKSYAQFAEEIGVQPSGISHILSGRNNPSLDFVLKMLQRYSYLSSEWLLFGRGPMHRQISQPTLFDMEQPENEQEDKYIIQEEDRIKEEILSSPFEDKGNEEMIDDDLGKEPDKGTGKRIARVLFFYSDKTFTEYKPS